MRYERRLFLLVLAILAALTLLAGLASSCSREKDAYLVTVVGISGDGEDLQRNSLLEYASLRLEAGLGVEVELHIPGSSGEPGGQTLPDTASPRLLVSFGSFPPGRENAQGSDPQPTVICLDWREESVPAGGEGASFVRYRMEEASHLCGFLAGRLTDGEDHPRTNRFLVVAFIGPTDDTRTPRLRAGFMRGVSEANPQVNVLAYELGSANELDMARTYAEEAVRKGADIIFCSPGAFDAEVIRVAETRGVLVILIDNRQVEGSPDHVIAPLALRDDQALFRAVSMALKGEMVPGMQEWGVREGIWSLASFGPNDLYIDRKLKEDLLREMEKLASIESPL